MRRTMRRTNFGLFKCNYYTLCCQQKNISNLFDHKGHIFKKIHIILILLIQYHYRYFDVCINTTIFSIIYGPMMYKQLR